MPHPPQQKNHLSAQPNTPNNRKDASITPSSRFLSFPQVSNHSSHSPSPQKISPLVTSTTNQVQCLRDFERFGFGEQNRGVFWGKIHIKSVIFSIKFAENYSSLPLLFLMNIFIFTMIIWWPHPRFCLGYLLVLLDADIFQTSPIFSLQRVNEHPVFLGGFSFQFRGPETQDPRLQSFLHGWLIILGGWKSKR